MVKLIFQLQALKQKLSNAEHDKETAENKKNKLKIELDSLIKQKNKMEAENRGLEAVIDKLKDEAKERKNSEGIQGSTDTAVRRISVQTRKAG